MSAHNNFHAFTKDNQLKTVKDNNYKMLPGDVMNILNLDIADGIFPHFIWNFHIMYFTKKKNKTQLLY